MQQNAAPRLTRDTRSGWIDATAVAWIDCQSKSLRLWPFSFLADNSANGETSCSHTCLWLGSTTKAVHHIDCAPNILPETPGRHGEPLTGSITKPCAPRDTPYVGHGHCAPVAFRRGFGSIFFRLPGVGLDFRTNVSSLCPIRTYVREKGRQIKVSRSR